MPEFDIDPKTGAVIPKAPTTDTPSIPPPPPVNIVNPNLEQFKVGNDARIEQAKEANAKLAEEGKDKEIKETLTEALEAITISDKLSAKETEVKAIFRNHGMDSMSVIKAWDELMSVLVLEK